MRERMSPILKHLGVMEIRMDQRLHFQEAKEDGHCGHLVPPVMRQHEGSQERWGS